MAAIRTITIAGVGLIGGSFALALKKAGFSGKIIGVSSAPTLEEALSLGVIDEGLPLEMAVPASDLVYLAQPISRILDLLPQISRLRPAHALVTDAGSTKQTIVEAAEAHMAPGGFLGGHPMAGKELRGVGAADANLFSGRTYILTPRNGKLESDVALDLVEWIGKIGAKILLMPPEVHDQVVALTSHLAQMASTALARTVADSLGNPEHIAAAGPGLAAMTRLAMSSYDIWRDILATNSGLISGALDAYIATLQRLRGTMASPQMEAEFKEAAEFAKRVRVVK